MAKQEVFKEFCKQLSKWGIEYVTHANWHVKLKGGHNFWPTTGNYHNDITDKVNSYPNFQGSEAFYEFLEDMECVGNEELETGPKKYQGDSIQTDNTGKSILEKAHGIVFNRDEEKDRKYGPFNESMAKAARVATELCNKEITTEDFYKCMIALKVSRMAYNHSYDTMLDALGYIAGLDDYLKSIDNE